MVTHMKNGQRSEPCRVPVPSSSTGECEAIKALFFYGVDWGVQGRLGGGWGDLL